MSVPVLSWLLLKRGTGGWQASTAQTAPTEASTVHTTLIHVTPALTLPTLRANPYPEVTDLFCRLPLSTLFYQLEAVNLGDLLRLSVRLGAKTIASCGFSRTVVGAPDAAKMPRSSSHKTPSPDNPIPGSQAVRRKRKLLPGPTPASPHSVTLPCSSASKFRNLNRIPFRAHFAKKLFSQNYLSS